VLSEFIVPADHLEVHRHPLSILEVRRILLEHIANLSGPPRFAAVPTVPVLPPVNAATQFGPVLR